MGRDRPLFEAEASTGARSISGLFIISVPYWAKKDGWDSDDFALRKDLSGLSRIPRIFLYHGRDDEEVPFAHLTRYEKRLPTATVRALAGSEHEFYKTEFPELVDDIKNLTPRVRPTERRAPFDPSFGTARDAADAIRRRVPLGIPNHGAISRRCHHGRRVAAKMAEVTGASFHRPSFPH
jgi:hypothetical protein